MKLDLSPEDVAEAVRRYAEERHPYSEEGSHQVRPVKMILTWDDETSTLVGATVFFEKLYTDDEESNDPGGD